MAFVFGRGVRTEDRRRASEHALNEFEITLTVAAIIHHLSSLKGMESGTHRGVSSEELLEGGGSFFFIGRYRRVAWPFGGGGFFDFPTLGLPAAGAGS